MHVLITGATGTIGAAVVAALTERGDRVTALTRDPVRARAALGAGVELRGWRRPASDPPPTDAFAGVDAVVNLLGEPVAQRWSAAARRRIHDSRVLATRGLVSALASAAAAGDGPRVLISQSATGFYGPRDDTPLDERAPAGDDFLASLTVAWEREALVAAPAMRVVCTRTGVVLSRRGGALARMLPFFRLGLGGPVAGGRQYVPWIHLDDVAGAILHCLDDERAMGPVNVTAPEPVTNAQLASALGRVLRRPAVLPVPAAGLRALYGQMAQIVTTGQRAVPAALLELGMAFRHPTIEAALRDVLATPVSDTS